MAWRGARPSSRRGGSNGAYQSATRGAHVRPSRLACAPRGAPPQPTSRPATFPAQPSAHLAAGIPNAGAHGRSAPGRHARRAPCGCAGTRTWRGPPAAASALGCPQGSCRRPAGPPGELQAGRERGDSRAAAVRGAGRGGLARLADPELLRTHPGRSDRLLASAWRARAEDGPPVRDAARLGSGDTRRRREGLLNPQP